MPRSSPLDPDRRGGTVTLDIDHAPAVVKALAEREILIDCRPDVGLRISPHFYTTDDELDALPRQPSTTSSRPDRCLEHESNLAAY